jgi:glycosyltransferase involved in cell wall biosynthesis
MEIQFTIVIPTYNRANIISFALQSVLAQTLPSFEVIVVDDGSTDKTEDIVKGFADARVQYVKVSNGERGRARNAGTLIARGKYITFLDSDDQFYPEHLQKAFEFIEDKNSPEVFHQGYEIKDREGKLFSTMSFSDQVLNFRLLKGNILSCMGVFLRKDVALKFLFEEERSLAGTEDWLLWLTLSARYRILHNPAITATLIQHKGRSVMEFNEESLIARAVILREKLLSDSVFLSVFGHKAVERVSAHMLTYLSLHAVVASKKIKGIRFLLMGYKKAPAEIFTRRTGAILKHLICS